MQAVDEVERTQNHHHKQEQKVQEAELLNNPPSQQGEDGGKNIPGACNAGIKGPVGIAGYFKQHPIHGNAIGGKYDPAQKKHHV